MYSVVRPQTSDHKMQLKKIDRIHVRELALRQLEQYITSGSFEPGGKIPSERDLAEQLGVGRSSIREALKVLEAIGLLETRQGEGTFVSRRPGTSFGRLLGRSMATWGGTMLEIMDTRQMFEVAAAHVAAIRATPDDLQALEQELKQMEVTSQQSPRDYLAADMRFHRLIGHATHNVLAERIIANLIDTLEETLTDTTEVPLHALEERNATHRDLLVAIVEHQPQMAAEAMRRHLQFASALWEAIIDLEVNAKAGKSGD
jgi:GntR family transcriptional repressor for pyruvate dehydrogenase complex